MYTYVYLFYEQLDKYFLIRLSRLLDMHADRLIRRQLIYVHRHDAMWTIRRTAGREHYHLEISAIISMAGCLENNGALMRRAKSLLTHMSHKYVGTCVQPIHLSLSLSLSLSLFLSITLCYSFSFTYTHTWHIWFVLNHSRPRCFAWLFTLPRETQSYGLVE